MKLAILSCLFSLTIFLGCSTEQDINERQPSLTLQAMYGAIPVSLKSVPSPLPAPQQQVAVVRWDGQASYGMVWGEPVAIDLGNGTQDYLVIVTLDDGGASANFLDYDAAEPYGNSTWHFDARWPNEVTLGSLHTQLSALETSTDTRLDAAEGDINTLEGAATSLDGRLASAEASIASNDNKTNTAFGTVRTWANAHTHPDPLLGNTNVPNQSLADPY